jgi:hypothetical protein
VKFIILFRSGQYCRGSRHARCPSAIKIDLLFNNEPNHQPTLVSVKPYSERTLKPAPNQHNTVGPAVVTLCFASHKSHGTNRSSWPGFYQTSLRNRPGVRGERKRARERRKVSQYQYSETTSSVEFKNGWSYTSTTFMDSEGTIYL